jgi:hypothetical protein
VEGRAGRRETETALGESPMLEVVPYERVGREVTPEMAVFRQAWLGSKAIHPLPELLKHCPECRRSCPFEESFCPYDGKALPIAPPASKAE